MAFATHYEVRFDLGQGRIIEIFFKGLVQELYNNRIIQRWEVDQVMAASVAPWLSPRFLVVNPAIDRNSLTNVLPDVSLTLVIFRCCQLHCGMNEDVLSQVYVATGVSKDNREAERKLRGSCIANVTSPLSKHIVL